MTTTFGGVRRSVWFLCTLLVGTASAAEPNLTFEKYRLSNGLTIILSEDHRLPQVAVNVWYHVGAANQEIGRSGFAHLFEHMMFAGAKHLPQAPLQLLESVGVSTTAANGTTDYDRTNYFEVVPSNELPLALWIESERMGFLLDTLDQKKLEVQRDVVSNERRQRYENSPYGPAHLRLCDLLFPKPHPYHGCVIGEIGDIQKATLEQVKDFFRRYYRPSNASIAIVGDFDRNQVKALIERYFATLPSGPPPPVPVPPALPPTGLVQEQIGDVHAAVPRLTLAWHGTYPYAEDDVAGDVLAMILAEGRTSRLYRSLVRDQQVAIDVSAGNASLRLGGYFYIIATAVQGHPAEQLKTGILEAVHALRDNGPTPQELERARRQLLAGRLRQMERIGGFGGKADLLNEFELFVGDPGFLPKQLERIRKTTGADVQRFVQHYLRDDARVELTAIPEPQPEVK